MKNQNFENFISQVDNHMAAKTRKSRNGRVKASCEMKCYWKTPKGGKFTYRGDDTQRNLKEKNNIAADTELKALQVQFGIIRKRIVAAVIYDNTIPYGEDNVLFHYDKGEIVVNNIEWNLNRGKKTE